MSHIHSNCVGSLKNSNPLPPQPPCFVRLETLRVDSEWLITIYKEADIPVKYSLQNSSKYMIEFGFSVVPSHTVVLLSHENNTL